MSVDLQRVRDRLGDLVLAGIVAEQQVAEFEKRVLEVEKRNAELEAEVAKLRKPHVVGAA